MSGSGKSVKPQVIMTSEEEISSGEEDIGEEE
jgi:hypothetical protein